MRLFCLNRIYRDEHIDGIGNLPTLHCPHSPWPLYSCDQGPYHINPQCRKPQEQRNNTDRKKNSKGGRRLYLRESGLYPKDGFGISELSKSKESLRPKRHSGVPVRKALIIICPLTSALKAVPVALMRRLTFSMTSTKASLRRYLMSLLR